MGGLEESRCAREGRFEQESLLLINSNGKYIKVFKRGKVEFSKGEEDYSLYFSRGLGSGQFSKRKRKKG